MNWYYKVTCTNDCMNVCMYLYVCSDTSSTPCKRIRHKNMQIQQQYYAYKGWRPCQLYTLLFKLTKKQLKSCQNGQVGM